VPKAFAAEVYFLTMRQGIEGLLRTSRCAATSSSNADDLTIFVTLPSANGFAIFFPAFFHGPLVADPQIANDFTLFILISAHHGLAIFLSAFTVDLFAG
jgi:hypothetical protein